MGNVIPVVPVPPSRFNPVLYVIKKIVFSVYHQIKI
jgi:hypothetical protein